MVEVVVWILMLPWLLLWFLSIVSAIAAVIFWIWMIVDVAKYQEKDKLVWILIVILGNVLGAIVYFFTEKRKRQKEESLKSVDKEK